MSKQYFENLRHEGRIVAEADERRRRQRQVHIDLLAAAKAALEWDAQAGPSSARRLPPAIRDQLRAAIAAGEGIDQ